MIDHNPRYRFHPWTVSFARNGYVVTTVDGNFKDRISVYKTVDSLVRDLITHCGLLESQEHAEDFAVVLATNDMGDK